MKTSRMPVRHGLVLATTCSLAVGLLATTASGAAAAPARRAAAPIPGIFTVGCEYSHSGMDDPIVLPGKSGASHMHEFFGNITTDANTTAQSLTAGLTTCNQSRDHSAYWVPAVVQNGAFIAPTRTTVYYRGATGQKVRPFPVGFKLVTPRGDRTTHWSCTVNGTRVKRSKGTADVPTCAGLEHLVAHVRFPSCWNGTDLDSADHKSHVVYPNKRTKACPADHPVRLPELVVNVRYPLSVRGGPGLQLTSGAASSMHADVFSAWAPRRQRRLVRVCLNRHVKCGPATSVR